MTEDLLARIREQFETPPPSKLGVAISGGSDSTALLHILQQCLGPDVEIFAATVNHGLRPEAGEEALQVRDIAESLGVSHTILRWRGWDGKGNLQDRARAARYDLLTSWAKAHDIDTLVLGHTRDDQAETVLMRLARASGVAGLSGMPVRRVVNGVTLLRPLLGVRREELRDYLRRQKLTWIEDPSNDDDGFERIRIRKALDLLEPLGISVPALAEVADNMARARDALDWQSFVTARDIARVQDGNVVMDRQRFAALPAEIARRLVVAAVTWIGGADYAPRRGAVLDALDAIREGRTITFSGCAVQSHRSGIWICREYNAVADVVTHAGMPWDNRWRLTGGDVRGLEIRALGENGLAQCPDWRDTGAPHSAMMAMPGLWKQGELIAAPAAGWSNGWTAELTGGDEEFFALFLSH